MCNSMIKHKDYCEGEVITPMTKKGYRGGKPYYYVCQGCGTTFRRAKNLAFWLRVAAVMFVIVAGSVIISQVCG